MYLPVRTESQQRGLPPEAAGLVDEFLRLNRRRVRVRPPLTASEYERWLDLRWRIEDALGGPFASNRQGPPRKALRVPSNLEVEYADPERETLSNAREIGEGGLFLSTERPAPLGSPLHLKLIGDDGTTLEVEGTVVWLRRSGDAGGPARMGVPVGSRDESQRHAVAVLVEAALAAL
jgi:Tfp pilus assembly protein PilZ